MASDYSFTKSYTSQRDNEKEEIKSLIKRGFEVKYFKNWIMINGKTFNGYNEKVIENLMKESIEKE